MASLGRSCDEYSPQFDAMPLLWHKFVPVEYKLVYEVEGYSFVYTSEDVLLFSVSSTDLQCSISNLFRRETIGITNAVTLFFV